MTTAHNLGEHEVWEGMPVSLEAFREIALEDRESRWELDGGYLRRKPVMTTAHNSIAWFLGVALQNQLSEDAYEVRVDAGHMTTGPRHSYIPDVMVMPRGLVVRNLMERADALEEYEEHLPLVVEVWSRTTGGYDIATKLATYQRRGDVEIWYIHPRNFTLTAWRKQPDGSYLQSHHEGGRISPVALPNVIIDLDALFARIRVS